MRYLITLTLLLAATTASAQEIEGPESVPEHNLVRLELTGLADGDSAIWDAFSLAGAEADGLTAKSGAVYVFTGPPGKYRVTATYLSDGKLGQDRQYVTIGDAPEPDPVPPEPDPEPTPPEPKPDDAPFPADGLSVLILYETETQNDLPSGQRAILFGREAREFLEAATDDRYRVFDADVNVSKAEPPWRAALDVPHESLPWLIISDGTTGFSGPLPADVDAFKALVSEYK